MRSQKGPPLKGKIDESSSYAGNVFWYIFEMASKEMRNLTKFLQTKALHFPFQQPGFPTFLLPAPIYLQSCHH